MGLFNKIICPKCGKEYSDFRTGCPNCGARKQNSSSRTPTSSDAVRSGTAAHAGAQANSRWRLIFGLCLVAAVIIAVIVLITTTLGGAYNVAPSPSPSPSASATPVPTPTPTPPPTPTVESVTIKFLGEQKTEFSMKVGQTLQLTADIYPLDTGGTVTWKSSAPDKCTVDKNGLVTGIGAGWGSVIATCYGKSTECKVLVS
ncbi:MAG: Ig-like domain-containing protein [Oscillospiraceae bacterium]